MDKSQCPNCGEWVEDLDGFGVLRHEKCGFCKHSSIDGGRCTMCGCLVTVYGEGDLMHIGVLKCDVCEKPAVGVAASTCGAVSFAYCGECLSLHREPWGALVANCCTLERGHVAEWFQPIIDATLEFYGKTEDDLWEEAEAFWKEYADYCNKEHENETTQDPA